jgi:hypothetical protein
MHPAVKPVALVADANGIKGFLTECAGTKRILASSVGRAGLRLLVHPNRRTSFVNDSWIARVLDMRKAILVHVTTANRSCLEAVAADRNSQQKCLAGQDLLTADGLGINAITRGTGRSKSVAWRSQERFMLCLGHGPRQFMGDGMCWHRGSRSLTFHFPTLPAVFDGYQISA